MDSKWHQVGTTPRGKNRPLPVFMALFLKITSVGLNSPEPPEGFLAHRYELPVPSSTHTHVTLIEQVWVGLSISPLTYPGDAVAAGPGPRSHRQKCMHNLHAFYLICIFQTPGGLLFPMGTGMIKDPCQLCKTSSQALARWQPGVTGQTHPPESCPCLATH